MLKKLLAATAATTMLVGGTAHAADAAARARTFKNCTVMHKTYPHGVGKAGAHDKTRSRPVTNFKRSTALYNANKKSDRDKDHIACEKH